MIIKKEERTSHAIRFSVQCDGLEVGRTYLYLIHNDLHDAPYGLVEDVFVEAAHRGQGIGTALTQAAIDEAKTQGCYKVIIQARYGKPQVHALYKKLGFTDHGKNFRMDFSV